MVNSMIYNPQNNEDFLKSFILQIQNLTHSINDQRICVKNIDSITVFCSKAFTNFLMIDSKDILGKITWLPLYNDDPEIEKLIIKEDQSVIITRESSSIFKVNNINNKLESYLCIKSPIINPTTNDVIGIFVNCIGNGVYNLLTTITQENKKLPVQIKLPHLNRREKQVIFLFLSHLSSNEIADALYKLEGQHIKKSSVDSIFNDQLYIKFSVNSRIALYNKLLDAGYDKLIPKEILSTQSLRFHQLQSY